MNTLEKDVKIIIKGIQSDLMDDEKIEMITMGKYYEKNGKTYIVYQDVELNEEQSTKTTVKISDRQVSILRYGTASTHLIFEEGTEHITPYETPFGMVEVLSKTREIDLVREPNRLYLNIVYYLEINQMSMGNNTFSIEVQGMAN